jgi:peptidoglycan/xylan/chitin deacetylase (PgdA/CDA1 family)
MNWTDKLVALACRCKRGGVILNHHTANAEQMRDQIELWGRHFDFIHHDELGKRLASPGNKPFCLITFDDGKKSNFTEAAPVLTRFGVPGVFYVVTKFASGELPALWFDVHTELVRRLGACPGELDLDALKRLPERERLERVESACRAAGFQAECKDADAAAMSWDDARELHKQGHTIGAHSETHAILTTVPVAEAKGEIQRSIAAVSENLGAPCKSFAFPNGNYTEELSRYALRCGVRTVMTTDPMWVGTAEQPWRLPRVQLHFERPNRQHQLKIVAAALGFVLKNPDDTRRDYIWSRWRKPSWTGAEPGWGIEDAAGQRQRG